MKYTISKKNKTLSGEIFLPASKSIANRLLIIQALAGNNFNISNMSPSDDTKVLIAALKEKGNIVDIGYAGTAMRFSTAYFAITAGSRILTGAERMKNRPIGILVDALKQLDADIEYAEKDGYPPLKINGKNLTGGTLEIDGSVSSQYITALLIIAPMLPNGLTIKLKNRVMSTPYIQLTLSLMEYFGIEYKWLDNEINIKQQTYKGKDITIEADWSGASYWYEMAALADSVDLTIHGLSHKSLQGDSILVQLFEQLGVKTTFGDNKIHLSKSEIKCSKFEFNFMKNPDLAQTFAVTLCMLGIPFDFSGLETLKIKETNRIEALQNELQKFGYNLIEPEHGKLSWDGKKNQLTNNKTTVKTYEDHRMAMSFAPIAIMQPLIIDDPIVVNKSYPNFWNDIKSQGFIID